MTSRHPPFATQAMKIMDQQGEAAMWRFIADHLHDMTNPNRQEPPKTVQLADGSLVHLANRRYTFIEPQGERETLKPTEQRKSVVQQSMVPGMFHPPQPLFIWPSQEHLYQALVQATLDDVLEEGRDPKPRATESNLNDPIPEALLETHRHTPTSNPVHQSTTDELEIYLIDLAQQVYQAMAPRTKEAIAQKAMAPSTPTISTH